MSWRSLTKKTGSGSVKKISWICNTAMPSLNTNTRDYLIASASGGVGGFFFGGGGDTLLFVFLNKTHCQFYLRAQPTGCMSGDSSWHQNPSSPPLLSSYASWRRRPVMSTTVATRTWLIRILSTTWRVKNWCATLQRKSQLMYSFSGNCSASVPISTFMCLWAIYIFPGLVHIFPCSRIGRPLLEIYKSLTGIWV